MRELLLGARPSCRMPDSGEGQVCDIYRAYKRRGEGAMPLIHNDPEHWPERAAGTLALAEEMPDPEGKHAMIRSQRSTNGSLCGRWSECRLIGRRPDCRPGSIHGSPLPAIPG